MKNYVKQLEAQNEELRQRLAYAEQFIPYWIKDESEGTKFINAKFKSGTGDWWYYIVPGNIVAAVIHRVKDNTVEGYKICVLKTPIEYTKLCNVTAEYLEAATTGTFDDAQKIAEERLQKMV